MPYICTSDIQIRQQQQRYRDTETNCIDKKGPETYQTNNLKFCFICLPLCRFLLYFLFINRKKGTQEHTVIRNISLFSDIYPSLDLFITQSICVKNCSFVQKCALYFYNAKLIFFPFLINTRIEEYR